MWGGGSSHWNFKSKLSMGCFLFIGGGVAVDKPSKSKLKSKMSGRSSHFWEVGEGKPSNAKCDNQRTTSWVQHSLLLVKQDARPSARWPILSDHLLFDSIYFVALHKKQPLFIIELLYWKSTACRFLGVVETYQHEIHLDEISEFWCQNEFDCIILNTNHFHSQ